MGGLGQWGGSGHFRGLLLAGPVGQLGPLGTLAFEKASGGIAFGGQGQPVIVASERADGRGRGSEA